MCSVDPDEIIEMTRATDGLDINSGNIMCRKCSTEKAVAVLRVKDAYCRECFLSYFVHKFRSTIGKSKQIRPGDRILIATSGGLSSSALLHLVREGLDESSHKKLRFEPAFLYIDESCLSDEPDKGQDCIDQVCCGVLSLNFQCYVTCLEQVMSTQPSSPILFTKDGTTKVDTSPDLREQLMQLMSACKSESAKQDLHKQLRRELLYQCVGALGYHKIFLADNATTLAVCILANVAMGRGSQLADRVQFKARHKDIEIYRPMRETFQNEVQIYLDLHNIPTLQAPSLNHMGSSITTCTEEFVMGLQKEFPATIPTIFRTGDKLVSTPTDVSKCSTPDLNGCVDNENYNILTNGMCAMCGLQLDTIQSESSAVHATFVSQKLSCTAVAVEISPKELISGNSKANNDKDKMSASTSNIPPVKNCDKQKAERESPDDCCTKESSNDVATNSCDCSQQTKCCNSDKNALKEHDASNKIPKNIIEQYLCYGCRIIVRELGEVNHLPIKVRGSVAEQERRKHMREQIQDFLL